MVIFLSVVCALRLGTVNTPLILEPVIMVRVFTNGPEDWGSIPGRVIPKTQKMVLDT